MEKLLASPAPSLVIAILYAPVPKAALLVTKISTTGSGTPLLTCFIATPLVEVGNAVRVYYFSIAPYPLQFEMAVGI